jgi:DNA replication and repair protein RecF
VLEAASVANFRCIAAATLTFDANATGIVGANASGKTSLLEALYFLANGRSFRTPLKLELVKAGEKSARIVATHRDVSNRSIVAGVEFDQQSRQLRFNGQPASALELAQASPTQIIDPSIHRLLEEGSLRRRRLVDWGVFHVKPTFVDEWRRYQRSLVQRNAALRFDSSQLRPWTEALVEASVAVHTSRSTYITELAPLFRDMSLRLLGAPAELLYRRGWKEDVELGRALQDSRDRELRQRTTVVGPHRADLEIRWQSSLARKRVSRGQQKLLAAALILAQIQFRAATSTTPVCLLLDDPAAELDVDNLWRLLEAVAELPTQLVLTSLTQTDFQAIAPRTVFHVEQGRFSQVV